MRQFSPKVPGRFKRYEIIYTLFYGLSLTLIFLFFFFLVAFLVG